MATEKITIIVEEKGSVVVKRSMKELGGSIEVLDKRTQGLRKSALDLRGVFGGIAAYLSVGALIKYSDSATRLANTLKIAGLEGEAFTEVQERLYQAGIRNGQNAESLGMIYQKLSIAQKDLGASGAEVIGVTEGIAAAMRLSTAGTGAQQGALQQLSQSFGGLKVQAQEFNSLIDGAYPLLQAAANGSDKWKGSVSALSRDVKESNVYTKDFFDALKIGLKDTEALAASMPLTIGQSFIALETAFTRWLANSNTAKVAAGALASAIGGIANNLDTVMLVLIPFGAALALVATVTIGQIFVGALVTATTTLLTFATWMTATAIPAVFGFGLAMLTGAVTGLSSFVTWTATATRAMLLFTASLLTNPIVLLGIAIAGVVAVLVSWAIGFDKVKAYAKAAYDYIVAGLAKAKAALMSFLELFNFEGGKLEVNANKASFTSAANTLKGGVTAGGTSAGSELEKGTKAGGTSAGEVIGTSMKDAASAAAEITKTGSTESAELMKKGIEDGGKTAGDTMNKAIKEAGTAVASMIKAASPAIAPGRMIKSIGGSGGEGPNGNATFNGKYDFKGDGVGNMSKYNIPGYARGGDFRVGGSGGTDSQPVQFMASPDEVVSVRTPAQRKAEEREPQRTPVDTSRPVTIINQFDPQAAVDGVNSRYGSEVVFNVVRNDPDKFRKALGLPT